jgi:Ca-activated chloride channel homolog
MQPNGSTALLDGVRLGMAQIQKARNARRALIVVSDGGENNSRFSLGELRKVAMEANVQIFSIGLHDRPARAKRWRARSCCANWRVRAAESIIRSIALRRLRGRWRRLGLRCTISMCWDITRRDAQAGKYRTITVQLCLLAGIPPRHIYVRTGYYTPEK